MQLKNTQDRYGAYAIGLHWLMLLLIAAVYACIELRVLFEKGTDAREAIKAWHGMLGLTILLLVVIRIALRFTNPTPAIRPAPPLWQQRLATLAHVLLYALMVVMPILGWLLLSAEGKVIPYFGLELPALISADKASAEWLDWIHEQIGIFGYFLIGLHAAAALLHHYVFRDNTLRRMLGKY